MVEHLLTNILRGLNLITSLDVGKVYTNFDYKDEVLLP